MPDDEPTIPEHCTACGSTAPDDCEFDAEFDGYSACCNEPVCSPLPVDFRSPLRYPAEPCCDADPRYAPRIAQALEAAGVVHHGLRASRNRAGFSLFLPALGGSAVLRQALSGLRRSDWWCRPDRNEPGLTVVRIDLSAPRGREREGALGRLDRDLWLAGFTPYGFHMDEGFWGYRAALPAGEPEGSPHVSMHGPVGLDLRDGREESARQVEAAKAALRRAGWAISTSLGHSFYATAPVA
ncbi:hypothetical protein ACFWXO_13470 [Kitasatospora sp. NPDC059088]|uniref:hypothetical protein n=1 Tax=Kitasatospora sp. NPDC059088 TaxID=3346722 RepID=UPI0036CF105D